MAIVEEQLVTGFPIQQLAIGKPLVEILDVLQPIFIGKLRHRLQGLIFFHGTRDSDRTLTPIVHVGNWQGGCGGDSLIGEGAIGVGQHHTDCLFYLGLAKQQGRLGGTVNGLAIRQPLVAGDGHRAIRVHQIIAGGQGFTFFRDTQDLRGTAGRVVIGVRNSGS